MLAAVDRLGLPDRRRDLRAAMQALITARSAGNRQVKFEDLLLDDGAERAEDGGDDGQTQEQMDHQMRKVAAMFDARQRRQQQQRANPADGN